MGSLQVHAAGFGSGATGPLGGGGKAVPARGAGQSLGELAASVGSPSLSCVARLTSLFVGFLLFPF